MGAEQPRGADVCIAQHVAKRLFQQHVNRHGRGWLEMVAFLLKRFENIGFSQDTRTGNDGARLLVQRAVNESTRR
jgi:hypothetical protein